MARFNASHVFFRKLPLCPCIEVCEVYVNPVLAVLEGVFAHPVGDISQVVVFFVEVWILIPHLVEEVILLQFGRGFHTVGVQSTHLDVLGQYLYRWPPLVKFCRFDRLLIFKLSPTRTVELHALSGAAQFLLFIGTNQLLLLA